MTVYDFTAKLNDGQERDGQECPLSRYRGQVLLIVNVASRCGFTPQYRELQDLFTRFRNDGFWVLGFPCDQFGHQEPGTDAEIRSFCELNYQITFPLFSKVDVNGPHQSPLYGFLKNERRGLLGSRVRWNFTKFLIDRAGKPVRRYAPSTAPSKIVHAIVEKIGEKIADPLPLEAGGSTPVHPA